MVRRCSHALAASPKLIFDPRYPPEGCMLAAGGSILYGVERVADIDETHCTAMEYAEYVRDLGEVDLGSWE